MQILYGQLVNGDTSTRTADIRIDDAAGGDIVTTLVRVSTAAAGFQAFPQNYSPAAAGTNAGGGGGRFILAGAMSLHADVDAVGAGQDATFSVAARIRGAVPTVTEAGNSTPTITINTEQVF